MTKLENFLGNIPEQSWLSAADELASEIHEADRDAIKIWLRFNSLGLHDYLASGGAAESVALQGTFGLRGRLRESMRFLYSSRYLNFVCDEIEAEATSFDADNIKTVVGRIAAAAARRARIDIGLAIPVTLAALMSVRQTGLAQTLEEARNAAQTSAKNQSADQVAGNRKRDDRQGPLGFLRTVNKRFTVTFDESARRSFPVMQNQEIASASQADKSRDWQAEDSRCWQGPVPIECVSASCGTCWIGVLGGREKLSEVSRRERRAMKVFGYNQPDDERPCIRLACQARAEGNVTITIPSWNAVFGKKIYGNVEELELEPVTTSAKALRDAVKNATSEKAS